MYRIFIIFFAFAKLLSASTKIEIGTASTYVPDTDNLTIDTSSGHNVYSYEDNSLSLTFSRYDFFFGSLDIGDMILLSNIDQKYNLTDQLILNPTINAIVVSDFDNLAATIGNPNLGDVVGYKYSYSPSIRTYSNNILSSTKSVTYRYSNPALLQYNIYSTAIVKVSVKQDATTTYVLTARYAAESAAVADLFFQGFSSSIQVADGDSDGDSIPDIVEVFIGGTDPEKADSNDDGINDLDDRLLRLSNNLYTRVNDNASNFGLLSESEVTDLRPSSTLISVEDGNATLSLGIEESSNLIDWVDTGETIDANLSAPQGTRFFRFKVND